MARYKCVPEGLVIKNLKRDIFGKFVNLEFQKRLIDADQRGGVHPEQRGIRNVCRQASLIQKLARMSEPKEA